MICHIIGCGTIGSRLAIRLCDCKLISTLHLYDSDIVTKPDPPIFNNNQIGIQKIDVISNYIKIFSTENISIFKNYNYLYDDIEYADSDSLIIDCRDNKSTDIKCDMKLSIDGNILLIDTMQNIQNTNSNQYYEYTKEKNIAYIDLAISIILANISDKTFNNNDIRLYDLSNISKGVVIYD